MKLNAIINRVIKKAKKVFNPKPVINEVKAVIPDLLIPKHEPKEYHNPPCSGIAKGFAKKRRAKIRMQKRSRIINRKAA